MEKLSLIKKDNVYYLPVGKPDQPLRLIQLQAGEISLVKKLYGLPDDVNPSFVISLGGKPYIVHQGLIDLAHKRNGRWQSKVGRDILFIERNLEFLRPGGRMCIVLPQGRYNNTTDQYIRDFIGERARILAVVGLHGNTFKPHTGTKTSVLFLQKWNEDRKVGPLCPRVEDYPVFFGTSQNGGKDNSGEYIYKKGADGLAILDQFGHKVVQHDLGKIAEGLIQFAAREGLSFWEGGH